MMAEFEKHTIEDFGQKLAHLEGLLGAYLPKHTFGSELQQQVLDCNKFQFSRLKSGKRMAANWELARFIDLFDLARFRFDYRLFLEPFTDFDAALKRAGVGSYGVSTEGQLREALRQRIDPTTPISIHRDRVLNVGGIGGDEDHGGLAYFTPRDKVTLKITLRKPVKQAGHFLLLHDFPNGRAMSCLMPSMFAPEPLSDRQTFRLPQSSSGYLAFPVSGDAGYRCLYGLHTVTNLPDYIGLTDATSGVVDLTFAQVALLVDFLTHVSEKGDESVYVSFGEYLLK